MLRECSTGYRLVLATFVACICLGTLASIAARSQGLEDFMWNLQKKCGMPSGKTPQQVPGWLGTVVPQMSKEEYDYCAGLADGVNRALGLPGPGFKVKRLPNNLPCPSFMPGGPPTPAGAQVCHPMGMIAVCTGAPGPDPRQGGRWDITREACLTGGSARSRSSTV
jgi:hypothetical protein